MDINSRYPIRHRLSPGGSGERAGDYIKQGLGLSPLPQGKKQRTIYSLYHARSGSDNLTASAAPLLNQSRRSEPSWIMALLCTIFIGFRGPQALDYNLRAQRSLGENPESIPRGRALTEQPVPQNVPAGLPSELLERRPDVRQAEQIMVAANAQIGVAKASFFPNLSLTGLGGLESNALHEFITAPAETWYAAFNVSQPVFQGGALRSQLRLARANWQEAVFSYQQTVQNALEQVSNSLVASQKNREFREQQELLTQAAQQTDQFSEVLYKNGGASYLQVLTSETNYFSAELNLVQAQLNERLALVQLYQTLGGGWQQ